MSLLSGFFNLIPHFIILAAVILYLKKYSTPEGIMMLVGAITGTLISVFYSMLLPFLVRDNGYEAYQDYTLIISATGTLGYFSFAIGLLMAIQKMVADKKE